MSEARLLAVDGHDVERAALTCPRALDRTLLQKAVLEDRILITYDRDFGTLVYRDASMQPPAIIYIRFEPDNVDDVLPRLMPLLDYHYLSGHITIIGPEHDRRRPFPAKS